MNDFIRRAIGFRGELLAPDDGTGPPSGGDPPGGDIGTDEVETIFVSSPEEIPKEEGDGPNFDPEELKQQNETLQQQIAVLQQQADVATQLNNGISSLGETLKKGTGGGNQAQAQAQTPQQQPGETETEFAERVKKEIYDDPYKTLNEMNSRTMQPFVNQIINNNVAMSRRLIALDPQKASNFGAYADEIDQEVATMPPMSKLQDPMVYDKAYERVVARHMDEIIEKSVADRLAEAQAKNQTQPQNQAGGTAPVGGFVEQSSRAPSGPRKEYRVLTPAEKQAAFNKGMNEQEYYSFLVRKGLK